ncbi:MAG: hypothetical protein U0X39_04765 [Bacteroidales bacterium]
MKKGALVVVAILFVAVVVLAVVILKGKGSILADPYKYIPDDAALIVESNDFTPFLNDLTAGNGFSKELNVIPELKAFSGRLKILRETLGKPEFRVFTSGKDMLISFHPDDEGRLRPLFLLASGNEYSPRQIRDQLKKSFPASDNYTFRGNNIITILPREATSRDTIFISVGNGLVRCATNSILLKESLKRTASQTDIRDLPGFSKVISASGKEQNKVFVLFNNLAPVIRKITGNQGRFPNLVKGRFAGCAGGDIYFDENGIILSGYLESTDSTEVMFRFKNGVPDRMENHLSLPAGTLLFETIIEKPSEACRDLFMTTNGPDRQLGLSLVPFITGEFTRAFLSERDSGRNYNRVFVSRLTNRDQTERAVIGRCSSVYGSKDVDEASWKKYFQPDDQVKIPYYITPFKSVLSGVFDGRDTGVSDSILTFYDNLMVSGNSEAAVTAFLYSHILNKTLGNSIEYREFEKTLPSRAGYFFYCVPAGILNRICSFLNDSASARLRRNVMSLRKVDAVGFQYAASNGMIYNTFSARYREKVIEDSQAEWATLLDTAAAVKPFFFTNHNTGGKEIFIQDYHNNAYLINSAGRVLWKVRLNERLIGQPYMIDYYRNGKYQLLFAGREYLHILDRNGNYIERYPVRLRSPATAPLAVFDYENDLSYRLLIPGEDRNIYAYDKTGSIVRGWNLFRTNGVVRAEIKFFRVSGKDYLVVSDETTMYFLDRTGNTRMKPVESVTRAPGSELRFEKADAPSVIFTSPEGIIQRVWFNGKVEKKELRKFSARHSADFFDVDGDGVDEYFFIDNGILYLYDDNYREIFEKNFESAGLEGPVNFTFSATDRKTGLYDSVNKLIYLLERDGSVVDGFPLRGASLFSIGKLTAKDEFNLIVGGTDNFLYNYRVGGSAK